MNYDLIKAHLNLFAVLQNLEDIVQYDPKMQELTKKWKVSIKFSIWRGPKLYIDFANGKCTVGRVKRRRPSIVLFFISPAHLNRMFENKGQPIPLKGLLKLSFLTKQFPKLVSRMEYFLKPTDELMKNKSYVE